MTGQLSGVTYIQQIRLLFTKHDQPTNKHQLTEAPPYRSTTIQRHHFTGDNMHIRTLLLPALLATTGVEARAAKPPKDFDPSYKFVASLQRYGSQDCKDPFGVRVNGAGKRGAIGEGVCHRWGDGQKWASFDYKWTPFGNYEADMAVDDPMLTDNKDSPDGKRYCSLRFWENDNCEGPSNTNLVRVSEAPFLP